MRKIFLKSILYPFFIIVLFIFTLPIIVSTKPGQKQFLKIISALTRTTVEVDEVKLSWFSNQEIDNLKIKNSIIDLNIKKITAIDSLIKAIFNKGIFSHIEIIKPECSIKFSQGKNSFFFIPCKQIELTSGNFQLQTFNKTYYVKNLYLNTFFDKEIKLKTSGTIKEENQSGNFSIDLEMQKNLITDFYADFSSLPVSTFDEFLRIFKYNYSLSNLIGKSINGSIKFSPITSTCIFDITSEYAKLKYNSVNKTSFSFLINTPGSGKKEIYSDHLILNFSNPFKSIANFQLNIDKLPLDFFEITNLKSEIILNTSEEIKYKGSCLTNSNKLNGEIDFNGIFKHSNESLTINLISKKLSIFDPIINSLNEIYDCHINLDFNDLQWNLKCNIGKFLNTFDQQKISFNLISDKTTSLLIPPKEIKFEIDSDFFKINSSLNLGQIAQINTTSPFNITISPSFLKSSKINYPLESTLNISGEIEKGSSIDEIKGFFSTQSFLAKFSKNSIEAKINNGEFTFDPKTTNGEITISAKLNDGELTLNLNKDSKNEWGIKTKLKSIPISLLECFTTTNFDKELFLGNEISGSVNYINRNIKKNIDGQLTTAYLDSKFSGVFEEKTFSFTKPSKINYKVPPRSNLNWFNSTSIYLVSEPKISLEFQDLETPINLDFPDIVTRGKLSIEDLKFYNNHEIGILEKIYGEWKKKKDGSLTAYLNGISPIGKIESSLEIERVQLSSLKNLLPTFSGTYHLYMQNFPTLFIKAFFAPFIDKDIAIILGNKINLDYNYLAKNFPKVMQFNLNSTSCNLSISGTIDSDSFNLIKPLNGTIEINDQLKELLVDLINIEIIDTINPIQIEASSKGFTIPIIDPSIKNIRIPYFKSNIGKIFVKNSGSISLLDQFLKINLPAKTQLWFTPIEGRLTNGVVSIERFDVLVSNNLPLAFWGKIDYNKRYVDCTLGLSAQSLKTTLGIKGLPDNFYLTIPLKGPFGKVKIDKAKVITKISALIASLQKFSGKLGGVLDLMNQLMNDQGKIPKAKRPFPWEIPLSSADIEIKKTLPIQFKKHAKEEEFLSYSVSIDPLLNLLQEQINQILTPVNTETEILEEDELPDESQFIKEPNQ